MPQAYGVDVDTPPSLDDDDAVVVPDVQVPQADLLQQELSRRLDPLDASADSDYGITCYINALHIINQIIGN